MTHPTGSVQGLCSSGATCFALSIAFLGAWGFQGAGSWQWQHGFALAPLLLACLAFGATPYLATRVHEAPEGRARIAYLSGVVLVIVAVTAALAISIAAQK